MGAEWIGGTVSAVDSGRRTLTIRHEAGTSVFTAGKKTKLSNFSAGDPVRVKHDGGKILAAIGKQERHPTEYPGVYYEERESRTLPGKKQKVFYIRYYTPQGERRFELAGEQANTARAAAKVKAAREEGRELPNRERKERRRKERETKRSAESSRWTFDKLWEAWLADPENKGKRGNLKADLRYKKHIKPRIGNREPSSLRVIISADGKNRHTEIDALRLDLARKYSKETTKSIISLISRISRYGASRGYCAGITFPIILAGKRLGRDPRGRRVPTSEELAAYIKTCREWPDPQGGNFQLLIVLTGMRRGSAWNLKWSDLDLNNHTAILRDSKTGDVEIELSDDAVSLLRDHPRTEGNPYVFTGTGPGGMRSLGQINRTPKMIRDAAGLPADLDPCHSFRRNLATMLDEAGASIATIQKLGGWKTPAMVLHYTATKKETLREAANLLGRKIGEAEANGNGGSA